MSGGHWNYAGYRLADEIRDIAADRSVEQRWPDVSRILHNLAKVIPDLEHEMDWDLSGDTIIHDDEAFNLRAVKMLRDAVTDDGLGQT